jgi:hypothetical protein
MNEVRFVQYYPENGIIHTIYVEDEYCFNQRLDRGEFVTVCDGTVTPYTHIVDLNTKTVIRRSINE